MVKLGITSRSDNVFRGIWFAALGQDEAGSGRVKIASLVGSQFVRGQEDDVGGGGTRPVRTRQRNMTSVIVGRVQDNQENVWRKQSLYFDLRLSRTYSTVGAVLDNKYKKGRGRSGFGGGCRKYTLTRRAKVSNSNNNNNDNNNINHNNNNINNNIIHKK